MSDPKNRVKNEFPESGYLDETVAASTDLTGLIQRPPADESEAESYAELHHVPVPDDVPERQR